MTVLGLPPAIKVQTLKLLTCTSQGRTCKVY